MKREEEIQGGENAERRGRRVREEGDKQDQSRANEIPQGRFASRRLLSSADTTHPEGLASTRDETETLRTNNPDYPSFRGPSCRVSSMCFVLSGAE